MVSKGKILAAFWRREAEMSKGKGHVVQVKSARKSTAWWRGEHQRKSKKAQGTSENILELWPVSERKQTEEKKCNVLSF